MAASLPLRVGLVTKEFPPEVYGGAGVHVEHLAAALAGRIDLEVHAFGAPRPDPVVVGTYGHWEVLDGPAPELAALRTLSTDLAVTARLGDVDLVHSHTWYANLAGHLASLAHDVPHVVTTHSLEPLRPWKAEQLGGGYAISRWVEQTALEAADAVIAVSHGMRDDVLACYPDVDPDRVHVVHNGIDLEAYRPVTGTGVLTAHGIDPDRPYAVFVGRITRQKGVVHLLDAIDHLPEGTQVVLAAGAPDTPAIADEFRRRVAELDARGRGPVWIDRMLPRDQVVELLSHAAVFVCPSIYEPFGIVNLEAMACGTAVVASAVGGIPEIVVPDHTGELVALTAGDDAYGSPADPDGFARALAAAISRYLDDPALAEQHGRAGRQRVEEQFGWAVIAEQTVEVYERARRP